MDVVVQEVPERGHRAVVGGLVVVGAEYAVQPGIRVEGGADADEGVAMDEHVGVDEHEHLAGRALGSGIACFRRPRLDGPSTTMISSGGAAACSIAVLTRSRRLRPIGRGDDRR